MTARCMWVVLLAIAGCRVTIPQTAQAPVLHDPSPQCVAFCAPADALQDGGRGCQCAGILVSGDK